MSDKAHLVLADGAVFEGLAMGARGTTTGEAVFTTGMTGYQEVLTDPSFCGQLVCMTAPQIGNTGTTIEDDESTKPSLSGFIVHELSPIASNWRSTRDLDQYLRDHGVVGIEGVDTRALTRHIRDHGAQQGAIGTESIEALKAAALAAPPMSGRNLTGEVTTDAVYEWTDGNGAWATEHGAADLHVVAIDYGMKWNIPQAPQRNAGCRVDGRSGERASAAEILERATPMASSSPTAPATLRAARRTAIDTIREVIRARSPDSSASVSANNCWASPSGAKTFETEVRPPRR